MLRRPWAFGAAVIGFTMVVIYVAAIVGEGVHSLLDVLPWATLMAVAAITALAAAHIEHRRIARNSMVAAAVLFAVLGAVSILSIRPRVLVGRGSGDRGGYPLQRENRRQQARTLTARNVPLQDNRRKVRYRA